MAIQGQEGSGIPDYLNLSAYAQTINAQASLANKIELVKPQGHTQTTDAQAGHAQTSNAQTGNTQAGHTQTGNAQTLAIPSTSFSSWARVHCPTCRGKFTVDQLKLHMPSCQGHTQTTDAQAGHAQTSNAQTGHTQTGNAQTPAIPSTSFNLSGNAQARNAQAGQTQTSNAQTGHAQAGHTQTGNAQESNAQAGPTLTEIAQTPTIPSTSLNLSGNAQASNVQAGHTQAGNAEVPAISFEERFPGVPSPGTDVRFFFIVFLNNSIILNKQFI